MEDAFGTLYLGKIGVDNLLLGLVGVGHIALFALKRRSGPHYHRLGLYLYDGICFLGLSLMEDMLRFRPLREVILDNYQNFVVFRILMTALLAFPIYLMLAMDIVRLIEARRRTEKIS